MGPSSLKRPRTFLVPEDGETAGAANNRQTTEFMVIKLENCLIFGALNYSENAKIDF